ncbi:uncharacterized protein [Centruroides vittatus]|uniref:uncharacterized protein n=1 Tax=Centruroides vittatus TaxID=120091 RepID=UPI0035104C46
MSDESLQLIDKEIRDLYDYCIKNGMTEAEILKAATPLIRSIQWEKVKKRFFAGVTLIIFIGICISLLLYDPVFRTICMFGRLFLIKILPFWDWTYLYRSACFISNPFYTAPGLDESDCQICEDLSGIDIVNFTTSEVVMERYLKNDIPFIVNNATKGWAVNENFNINNITEIYLDELESNDEVCMFQTNLKIDNHINLLETLTSHNLLNRWYAHWENCGRITEKALRKLYSRPYFTPLALEMREPSWILLSYNFKGRIYKMINFAPDTKIVWLVQIRGFNYIQLKAKEPCFNSCEVLHEVLHRGQIFMFTTNLWQLEYLPGEDAENIALIIGGYFD